ncbi:MAG: hypothetical protein U0Q19_12105 [Kineosporiaceae bacterium]
MVDAVELAQDGEVFRLGANLLGRLAQCRGDHVLVAVPGAPRQRPEAALVHPIRPELHQGAMHSAGAVADRCGVVQQEQAGGAEPAPVGLTAATGDPAVAVVRCHDLTVG